MPCNPASNHLLSALLFAILLLAFHTESKTDHVVSESSWKVIKPPGTERGNETFHLMVGSSFEYNWTIRMPIDTTQRLPIIIIKKVNGSIEKEVKWDKLNSNWSQRLPLLPNVMRMNNKVKGEICEDQVTYFFTEIRKEQTSTNKELGYLDITLKIPRVDKSCELKFDLVITDRSPKVVINEAVKLKAYEKAKFSPSEVIFKMNNTAIEMEVAFEGYPQPKIQWFCQRFLASESFELSDFTGKTKLVVSSDFLPYKQCINVSCTISNRVCEGYDLAKNQSSKGNSTCYLHSVSLWPQNKPLSSFLTKSVPTSNEGKTLSTHQNECMVENKFCKHIFAADYLTPKINRDMILDAKSLLSEFANVMTSLCEEFTRNLTCSYMFTDETCYDHDVEENSENEFFRSLYMPRSRYFCKENVVSWQQFCPREFVKRIAVDEKLNEHCTAKFNFKTQFPSKPCSPEPSNGDGGPSLWRYTHKKNITITGRQCKSWAEAEQSEFYNTFHEFMPPSSDFDRNYCRHVLTKNLTQPGCFLGKGSELVFETCSVVRCSLDFRMVAGGDVASLPGIGSWRQDSPLTDRKLLYATPLLAFIILMLRELPVDLLL